MQGVTLTFPAGFDPFNLPSEEVQRTVQNLWIEAANRELAEAVAGAVPEDYATLTPEDVEYDALPPTDADIDLDALKDEQDQYREDEAAYYAELDRQFNRNDR